MVFTPIILAYPFTVEIWDGMELLANHPRCYGRYQDILDPLHYLPLLEQRPGAFDFTKPMKQQLFESEGVPERFPCQILSFF